MADKIAQRMEDLLTMYKTTLLDLPLAGAKWGSGMGQEKEVAETVWKGYDAWVRLTNASVDDLYRNPLFGDVLARSLDGWLRWQRLSQALVGAFFAALWPAVGLPTAAAVQALHEDLSSLDAHVKAQDTAVQTLRTGLRALQSSREDFRLLTADLPTRKREDQSRARLAERRAILSAQRNGNGNGAVHNNGTRAAPHKKLTNGHARHVANGHAAKGRRKNDAITA